MQTIKPAPTQIFAKPSESVRKTKSGIILSEEAAEKPQTAEVINVGSKVEHYQAKDIIVYKLFTTSDIKLNGDDYIIIAEEDVLGTVQEVQE